MTRNPYAGMWLLPLLLMLSHTTWEAMGIGMMIGLSHSIARALGTLHNYKHLGKNCSSKVVLTSWRWRLLDGLALLVVASLLLVYFFYF
jgi:hypothetical protein